MKARWPAAVCAILVLVCCEKPEPPPAKVKRAQFKPVPLTVPVTGQRSALRDAYRLGPDRRFLLASGELRRLGVGKPSPPAAPATAVFGDGKWTVRLGESEIGSVPELPDFADYLALLVSQARREIGSSPKARPEAPRERDHDGFLMPGLLARLRAAETAADGGSFPAATRVFARLAFQMTDRMEVAPLIPARAVALLAASRARDPHGFLEEEVLLAHALGYTRHAEAVANALPEHSPLRLFESPDDEALREVASKPGASDELRYLALRRTIAEGDLARWKEARDRLFPGDRSPVVMSTGLDLALPPQVEVEEKREIVADAIPRALVRELTGSADPEPASPAEFDSKLASAAGAAAGLLWDGAALSAFYQAQYFSPISLDRQYWPPSKAALLERLASLLREDSSPAAEMVQDGIGAPLSYEWTKSRLLPIHQADMRTFAEVRALVRRLDCRPTHRSWLAYVSHYNLMDTRAAEDLHRSLLAVLGDGSAKARAESALYVGDWGTLEAVLRAPRIKPATAAAILWSWYSSKSEPDRLAAAYEQLTAKFPADWNLTSYYVDLLRVQKKYGRACEIGERWLSRNTDPSIPGHFHGYVRLAHSYVLARQFGKGRRLLEGMNDSGWFQNAIRQRGLAECLAGEGKLAEAEALLREAIHTAAPEPETNRDMVRILWMQGRPEEAAKAMVTAKRALSQWEMCDTLSDDLADVFRRLPLESLTSAVAEVLKQPALADYRRCLPNGFAKARLWEDAFRVAAQGLPPGASDLDGLITRYGWMKQWKGRQVAGEWLKKQIRPAQLNPLSMKALYSKNDDLLWDVIAVPDPNNHPEWVWDFRAAAFALRGAGGDARRKELLAHYEALAGSADPYDTMGRYVLGLATEADMFALVTTRRRLAEVAYYLGVRAENEHRYRDASDWYRVAVETPEDTSPRTLAIYTLMEWMSPAQGVSKYERNPGLRDAPASLTD